MDTIFKTLVAAAGSVASFLFGGWSFALQVLIIFVFLDYVTGMVASGTEGKLSSQAGFKGIFRKVLIFVLVTMGHLVDGYLGTGNSMFRDGVIAFFVANEALSIVENSGRMGLPIPPVITRMVDALKDKSGEVNK